MNLFISIFLSLVALEASAQIDVTPDGTVIYGSGNQRVTGSGDILTPLGNSGYSVGSSGRTYWQPSRSTPRRSGSNVYDPRAGEFSPPGERRVKSRGRTPTTAELRAQRKRVDAIFNPSNGYARNEGARSDSKTICYCGRSKGQCIIGRTTNKLVLEQMDGGCSINVCEVSFQWSVYKKCAQRWRPVIVGIPNRNGDDDGDGVPNGYDLCPRTPPHREVGRMGRRTGCALGERYYLKQF